MRTSPSITSIRTGSAARPSITIWSMPDFLSLFGIEPPTLEWVTRPHTGGRPGSSGSAERVTGLKKLAEPRPAVWMRVSLGAEQPITIRFSGPSGSRTGPPSSRTRSASSHACRPRPPTKSRSTRGSLSRTSTVPRVRSTNTQRPL